MLTAARQEVTHGLLENYFELAMALNGVRVKCDKEVARARMH